MTDPLLARCDEVLSRFGGKALWATCVQRPGAADAAHVLVVEIERRSGQDRRARETQASDALESFWREVRSDADRRGAQPNSALVRIRDAGLEAGLKTAASTLGPHAIAEVFLIPSGARAHHGDAFMNAVHALTGAP